MAVQGCTAREVEDAVRGHQPGDDPDDRPDPALETRTVRIEMEPRTYALFLQARRALEAEHGQEMTDSEFMEEVSLGALERVGKKGGNKPAHAVAITVCRECQRGWQETGSKSIELPPADVERARCDAVLLGDVDGEVPEPTEGSIPRPVRRAVLARDHFRCVVPGCRSANHIDVHHVDPRAVGGPHEMMNLLTLCSVHHAGVHKRHRQPSTSSCARPRQRPRPAPRRRPRPASRSDTPLGTCRCQPRTAPAPRPRPPARLPSRTWPTTHALP
jgi:hypothetical protein